MTSSIHLLSGLHLVLNFYDKQTSNLVIILYNNICWLLIIAIADLSLVTLSGTTYSLSSLYFIDV